MPLTADTIHSLGQRIHAVDQQLAALAELSRGPRLNSRIEWLGVHRNKLLQRQKELMTREQEQSGHAPL